MKNKNYINYNDLKAYAIDNLEISPSSIHGPSHWERVERFGLYLSQKSGADQNVVRLFAIFHDCKRFNDAKDNKHGLRGANVAKLVRNKCFGLSDKLFDLLYEACENHTDILFHEDPTIGTCWDADRLDLRRIGRQPDVAYLNTGIAKTIVTNNSYKIMNGISDKEEK